MEDVVEENDENDDEDKYEEDNGKVWYIRMMDVVPLLLLLF